MRRQDGIPVWKEWAPWGQTIWNGLRPSKHCESLRWCIMDYLHCCLCLLCLSGIGMSHTNSPPNLGRLATKVFSVIRSKDLEGYQNLGTCRKLKHKKLLEKCMASLVGAWRFSWRFCWYFLRQILRLGQHPWPRQQHHHVIKPWPFSRQRILVCSYNFRIRVQVSQI